MLKQVRHLVAYDVRAVRVPILLWGAVLATEAALLLAGPAPFGIAAGQTARGLGLGYGALVVRLALTAILVALVVQRDPLVGSTAFWRTRPILRHRLLAGKIATVGLLVVAIPWLVTLVVLLVLGLPLPAAARGASSVGVEQALVSAFALAAAALTVNLAHFVIAAFAGLTLVMTILAVLPLVAAGGSWLRELAMGWASGVFTAIAVAGALAAAVHQFLTLRTGRSAAVMASLLVAATVGGALWHPIVVEGDARPVDASWLTPGAVSVRVEGLEWTPRRRVLNGAIDESRGLTGAVMPAGEPDSILLALDSLDVSLRYAGRASEDRRLGVPFIAPSSTSMPGGRSSRTYWPSTELGETGERLFRALRVAIGDGVLARRSIRVFRDLRYPLGAIPEDEVSGLTGAQGVIEGTVRFRAFRYVVTARTPARVGNRIATASQHSTIVSIGPAVRTTLPVPFDPNRPGVDVELRSTVVGSAPWLGRPTGYFLLRNEARRQSVLLVPWGFNRFTPVAGLASLRTFVDVWTGLQHLEFDETASNADFSPDDDWLRGAELLLVEPEELGVVTVPLHVEGVPAPGGP